MRLLLTRPQAEAERTAAALRARGHEVVIAPLMQIEALPDADLRGGQWAAILVTSANAAAAIAADARCESLRSLPVFAVGERSAAAMRGAGFAEVASADGDAGDLARLLANRLRAPASLLYLSGADRSRDLAGVLSASGFAVHTAVIYRAVAAAALPGAAAEALRGRLDGVLHFSRRSAEAYIDAARDAGLLAEALNKPVHFCLSAQVAEPLVRARARDIRTAPRPVEDALIDLIPPREPRRERG